MDFFDLPLHSAIGSEHLAPYEDAVKEGDIGLLCTGMGYRRGRNKDYVDNWIFLSPEEVQWMVENKINGVCIDGLSLGGPRAEDDGGPTHKKCL